MAQIGIRAYVVCVGRYVLWLLLFFTLELIATTMQPVVTKSAEALGKSEKPNPPELSGGESRCFPPYCTRDTRDEGAQND